MLNDKTSPSKNEVALLYKVFDDIQQCRKIALEGASKTHPLILLNLVESFSERDRLWAQATSGRLTWGQFNEGRKAIQTQAQTKAIQANVQISAQLSNQHQFELQQRARAAAAFQQWSYQQQRLQQQQQAANAQLNAQQQTINAINRPRTINCSYYGNTAQCNSY